MKRVAVLLSLLLLASGASAQKYVSDGVAVLVNDSIITYQDVEQYIAQVSELLHKQYANQPEVLQERLGKTRHDGTEQLIERQLIIGEFKTAGYNFPASIIEDSVQERIKRDFADRTTLMRTLRAQGVTYETYRQRMHDEIIVDAMRRKNVPQDSLISPQKILNYYEENKTNFAVADRAKVRMIVLNKAPGDNGTTKQLAGDILRKINEGAAFTEMAKIHSDGPQRANGGDGGWIERGTLRKELDDAAFSLKPGGHSAVIELPEACWLVQVDERSDAHVKPLSEVRDEIERTLRLTDAARAQKKWIARLREKAFVRTFMF